MSSSHHYPLIPKLLFLLAGAFILGGQAGKLHSWQKSQAASASLLSESTSWGLSFQKEGERPVGNATINDLGKYHAYYAEDTNEKKIYLTFDAGYENGNHCILVYQPLGDDDRFLGADRPHGEVDQVITHAVVPGVRQVQDAHRAQVRVGDAAHQLLAALLAVHGHGHGALEQRHAHDAVAQAEAGVGVGDVVPVPARGALGDLVLERLAGARVGDVVPLQQGVEQLRVRTVAVVALAVVLDHQLPVGLLAHGALHRDLGVLHVVRLHVVSQGREELVDGRRIVRQADEDEAAGGLAVHRLEVVVGQLEAFTHLGAGEQQAAVQLVGPLVVGAHQFGDLALVADAQARTAMAADVVEGMDLTFGAADDDDRVVADLHGEEVALGRNLAGHAGDQPLLVEDLLHVDLEQAFVVVEGLRQREAVVALVQHLGGGLADGLQWVAQAQVLGAVHVGSSLAARRACRKKWLIRYVPQGLDQSLPPAKGAHAW